jgi:hypothetical protein
MYQYFALDVTWQFQIARNKRKETAKHKMLSSSNPFKIGVVNGHISVSVYKAKAKCCLSQKNFCPCSHKQNEHALALPVASEEPSLTMGAPLPPVFDTFGLYT